MDKSFSNVVSAKCKKKLMNKFALSLTLVVSLAALPLFRVGAEGPDPAPQKKADTVKNADHPNSINDAALADVAASIRADHAYVLRHPESVDEEALRLYHDAIQRAEMDRLQAMVEADNQATRNYYAQFSGLQPWQGGGGGSNKQDPNEHIESYKTKDGKSVTDRYNNENPLPK
jgi:hypothetical protein